MIKNLPVPYKHVSFGNVLSSFVASLDFDCLLVQNCISFLINRNYDINFTEESFNSILS